jgi:hypothetical protein
MRPLSLLLLTVSLAQAQSVTDRFLDEYYFPFNPSTATSAGIHRYDGRLEDYSKTGITRRITALKKWETEVGRLPASDDRELVLNTIRAALLESESVRGWERNPDSYSSGIVGSAFTIMSRTFAPAGERLQSLIERERQMPKVLLDARANLQNPPRIFTEVAIEQLPGILSFFEEDVALAFTEVQNPKLLADFKVANAAVIKALKGYATFLKDDRLTRSNGDFRLGVDRFTRKLQYEEMVDIPLDRLLEIG